VGTAGLILVPFGAMRLAAERLSQFARWRFHAALLALIATVPVWALAVLAAFSHSGLSLAVVVLLGAIYATRRAWRTVSRFRRDEPDVRHVMPLHLTIVPLAVALLQFVVVGRAEEFSRHRAMRNAAPVIAAIERFRAASGHYPPSLLAVWADDKTGVIGVERYRYEPHFAAYNLLFEQFTYTLGTREFVVYNPRDEQAVTAHMFDLLELTPQQLALERRRGHYEEAAPVPHWKYFRFD